MGRRGGREREKKGGDQSGWHSQIEDEYSSASINKFLEGNIAI